VLLVIPEGAGAFGGAEFFDGFVVGVPDLNLRNTAEVNAAIAVFVYFPIDPHFEIPIILRCGEKEAGVAIANENAVFDAPMFASAFGQFLLARGTFVGRHRFDLAPIDIAEATD
jgi:hypothetical protein